MQDQPPLYPKNFRARPQRPRGMSRFRHPANRRTVTMPDRVGPHVRLVFSEMARLRVTYEELDEISGVNRPTIKQWRRKTKNPSLESLEAVLNALGWGFTPTPALETMPPHLAGAMTELALQMQRDIPTTWAILLDWTARQQVQAIAADQRLAEITRRREAAANDNRKRADAPD